MTSLPWFEYTNVSIIGLSSSLTEEQAKEFVPGRTNSDDEFPGTQYSKNEEWIEYEDIYSGEWFDNPREAIYSLIESSGLTIGKDQDCLILKIN